MLFSVRDGEKTDGCICNGETMSDKSWCCIVAHKNQDQLFYRFAFVLTQNSHLNNFDFMWFYAYYIYLNR